MAAGLLFECDEAVANWLFEKYKWPRYKYDRAVGIIDKDSQLVGAVLFQNWNGNDVHISYYGHRTMSLGIIRCLARFTLLTFNPSRLTAVTSKRNRQFIRALQKIGFGIEGTQRCYYGPEDNRRNTGVRFVMFRAKMERLAKLDREAA